jgi:phosphatidylserine/phosphatidylglycerophosphate/cardiolipin synthase-like enzyme
MVRPAQAQVAGYPDFELVETTPVETILDNTDIRDAHDVWLAMISGASTSLDIEQFYVSAQKGEPLDDIIAAVIAAASRGVRVRLIADARMYKTYPDVLDSLGRRENIAVRIIDFGKLTGGIQHAKYFIVDGAQIFLGSQNFDWRALKHIHELGFRIAHAGAVAVYQDIFNLDWDLAGRNDTAAVAGLIKPAAAAAPFHILEAPGDTLTFSPTMSPRGLIFDSTLWDEHQIVSLIDGAERELDCQVLTYSPLARDKSYYAVLENALKAAAARGVKVRMIVADWGKERQTLAALQALAKTPNIELKFSAIPEWSGGYIPFARVEHCKFLVADSSRCWLGTSNWEKSYFYTVRNLGVAVRNAKITSLLRRVFLKSWDGPYTERVTADGVYTPREHGERR